MSESVENEPSEFPVIGDDDASRSQEEVAELFASFDEKKKGATGSGAEAFQPILPIVHQKLIKAFRNRMIVLGICGLGFQFVILCSISRDNNEGDWFGTSWLLTLIATIACFRNSLWGAVLLGIVISASTASHFGFWQNEYWLLPLQATVMHVLLINHKLRKDGYTPYQRL